MSAKSRLTPVNEVKSFVARLEPEVWNAAATISNATNASVNTIVNDAMTYYMSSGQALAAYVSPIVDGAHGAEMRAAIDKLSGE